MKKDENINQEEDFKEDLNKKDLVEFEDRISDLENQLKRAVADYRNLEKRMQEEKRETIKYANHELFLKMIPAFDTLFLAAKFTEDSGVKLTAKNLLNVLSEVGVEKIKTEGEKFNPEYMEAVDVVEGEDGMVIEEVRPGFILFEKLLRPAHVKVGNGSKSN